MSNVLDLDVLRPKKRIVKLGGNEIDVSFIPLAITFDIDAVVREAGALDQAEVAKGGDAARRAWDLSVRMCATFCSWKYPEMDEEWFNSNVDAEQLHALASEIRAALTRAYEGIDSKNAEAVGAS